MNKLDRPGAEPNKCIEDIRRRLGANAIAVQLPIGKEKEHEGVIDLVEPREIRFSDDDLGVKPVITPVSAENQQKTEAARAHLIEKVAEVDESILEKFVDGSAIEPELLRSAIRRATLANLIVPTFMGAAFRNKGIQPLLDGIIAYLPSPADMPPVHGIEPMTEKEVERKPDPAEPLCALVFKIFGDTHGDLSFLRLYSGVLKAGELIYNARTTRPERANRIFRMHANDRQQIEEASAGDIIAIPGLKDTVTGDTIHAKGKQILLERSQFPEPVISMAIEPKSTADRDRLLDSLKRLEREDPTFRARVDAESGQVLIAGMGELHLEVLRNRLDRELRIPTNAGKPFVSYRETIQKAARGVFTFDREIGGRRLFASAAVSVEPSSDAKPKITVAPQVQTSPIAPLRAVVAQLARSLEDAAQSGSNFGYPTVNLAATLESVEWTTETTEVAAQAAASEAFQEALRSGGGELLEPILRFEIRSPAEFLSGVLNDLQGRRGVVEDLAVEDGMRIVRGTVPAGETFGYTTALRSLSQGRASASLEPARYAVVPERIRREVTGA
jgi:elongation factor G